MVSTKAGNFQEEHERELQQAVDEAEERATRELKAALKRLRDEKEDEKNKALRNQKEVKFVLWQNSQSLLYYIVANFLYTWIINLL